MTKNGVASAEQKRINHGTAQHPECEIAPEIARGLHLFSDGGDVLPPAHIRTYMTIEAHQDFLANRPRHECCDQPRQCSDCGCDGRTLREFDCVGSRKGICEA